MALIEIAEPEPLEEGDDAPRRDRSLRIIRKVLSTASTTKAVDAAPAMPGVVWPDCTPI